MRGHEAIIAMRQRREAPAWVWVSETGDDWGKFYDAMPTVVIEKTERIEQLDLRWAVGLNLSIAVVGVDRMKALKNEFEKIKPKRMVCQTLEKTDRFMPFEAIECTDTDGVAQWQR